VGLRNSISIAVAVVGITVVPSLFAQTDRGSIVEKITDSMGAIVGSASITIKNEETGLYRSASQTMRVSISSLI
jgi:hypothetical protein